MTTPPPIPSPLRATLDYIADTLRRDGYCHTWFISPATRALETAGYINIVQWQLSSDDPCIVVTLTALGRQAARL